MLWAWLSVTLVKHIFEIRALGSSFTSHFDIQGIESSCMHFDDHLVWIVKNRKSCVFGESEHAVISVLINNPGVHYRLTAGRRAERFNASCVSIQSDTHTARQLSQHVHDAQTSDVYYIHTHTEKKARRHRQINFNLSCFSASTLR